MISALIISLLWPDIDKLYKDYEAGNVPLLGHLITDANRYSGPDKVAVLYRNSFIDEASVKQLLESALSTSADVNADALPRALLTIYRTTQNDAVVSILLYYKFDGAVAENCASVQMELLRNYPHECAATIRAAPPGDPAFSSLKFLQDALDVRKEIESILRKLEAGSPFDRDAAAQLRPQFAD